MDWIDAHSHVWSPDTEQYPLSAGFRRALMDPPSFTPEQLLQHSISSGVSRILLIQVSFHGYDNSYILHAIEKYPERFRGVAVIDTEQSGVKEVMLKLKGLGIRGFRIYPKDRPVEDWLSSRGMHEMWACGTNHHLAMCCLIDPDALPALDRMCEQFPDTPVVVDHMCRIGSNGTILEDDIRRLCSMSRHANLSVKLSCFYALGKKRPPYDDLIPLIRRLYHAFGPARLMWASDSPFQVINGHSYPASINLIQTKLDFLSAGDVDWLLRKTAEKLFFSS